MSENDYPSWINEKLRWLEYDNLPEGLERDTARRICLLAYEMVDDLLPRNARLENVTNREIAVDQLLIGLQRLIDAKDPLVRVAVAIRQSGRYVTPDASSTGTEGPAIATARILLNAVRNPGEGLAMQHEVLSEANDDAWGSVWLYGNWKNITRQMTNIERELAADCVMRWDERINREDGDTGKITREHLRWWRY